MKKIQTIGPIVVIGSGIMGSGIAAQIANAGLKVYLLDINDVLAQQAIAKLENSNALASPALINNIIPGSLENNLAAIKSADWIIEVIIENLELKQQLYKKLEQHCSLDCIISSNTSTIPLKQLIEGMSKNFKQNFLITHFFNPPRFMNLLELITSEFTSEDSTKQISDFIDIHLGKTIVKCNDTPGFIANRIGCYWLETALSIAINHNIPVEDMDYMMGEIIGVPKTAIFGLYDLIGIDLMSLISQSLCKNLNHDDDFVQVNKITTPLIKQMIEQGLTGRKGKGGFYRVSSDEHGKKTTEILDLKTQKYYPAKASSLKYQNIQELIENNPYAFMVLSKSLSYAASLIPEISDDLSAIDQAIKLGYNWKFGPFELIDLIGPDYFSKKLLEQNLAIPPILQQLGNRKFYQQNNYFTKNGYSPIVQPEGIIFVKDFYQQQAICKNTKCSTWNIFEKTALIEITSKMAMLEMDVFQLIDEFFEQHSHKFKAIIIANDQANFSAGGDLKFMLAMAQEKNWLAIDNYLKLGQQIMLKLKYSPIPVIAALKGMALGGGCELLLHSTSISVHINSNSGLVETGVGLIPSWGGCKEMILRSTTAEDLIKAFQNILMGKISSSAYELKDMLKLDQLNIIMNHNRVLEDAIAQSSRILVNNKQKTSSIKITPEQLLGNLQLIGYDQVIAQELASLFLSSNPNEEDLLEQERAIFIKLMHNQGTQERISHMLTHGKRLKN